jgi:hypothetical protein
MAEARAYHGGGNCRFEGESQAQALEDAAEAWEALVRLEKPPIRGYNFLRARAAAIRDGGV